MPIPQGLLPPIPESFQSATIHAATIQSEATQGLHGLPQGPHKACIGRFELTLSLIMPGSAVPGGLGGGAPPWFELVIRLHDAWFGGSRRFALSFSSVMPGSAVPGGWGGGAPPWFRLVSTFNNARFGGSRRVELSVTLIMPRWGWGAGAARDRA